LTEAAAARESSPEDKQAITVNIWAHARWWKMKKAFLQKKLILILIYYSPRDS